ncbi:MAG TPA: hypothetical protein VKV22_02190 [Rhodanobacteraceae bacterium]|nr:hypothetical protein [Rhodanobacteraceae bacterium]
MEQQISIRLSGDEARIDAVVSALRGLSDVDGLLELGVVAPQLDEDSSSAGLPDDTPSGFQDIEVHVPNSLAYDHVHGRIETLAAHAGVVVEWLDED